MHVVNIALHWVNAALLYALAFLLTRRWPLAIIAALIFAVHPITTESVTNIIGRADQFAALAVLSGLIAWRWAGALPRWWTAVGFALVMLILMFSLAGVPPMVGFYAKLSILQAVLAGGQIWLAIVAVMFSLIGAFYYLRVVKLMYFDAPTDSAPIVATSDMRVTLSLNGIAIVALGILPGGLMAACESAIGQSIGHALKNLAGIAA